MKLIWCNGFPEIYTQLGGGVNLLWVHVHSTIYMKLIWCNGFPEIYGHLEEGGIGSVYTGTVLPVGFSKKKCKKNPIISPPKTQFERKRALFSDYIIHKKLICLP